MNIQNIILIAIIAVAVIFAVKSAIKHRGSCSCSGCTGCCKGCNGACGKAK